MLRYLYQFRRWRERQRKADLELISLHIPKTAGTSFRNTLKSVYGQEAVVRLDVKFEEPEGEWSEVNQLRWDSRQVPPWARVLHGHFTYPRLQAHFDLPEQRLPLITWLRDPVERVISNYYYLRKRMAQELDEERKGIRISQKMQRRLMEYARDPMSCNRMSRFLDGVPLERFLFIGIQQHYTEDLKRLARLLEWQGFQEFEHNRTGKTAYEEVSTQEQEEIRALNDQDVRLYEAALQLREQSLQSI